MLYDRLLQEAAAQRAAGIDAVQEALMGFDDLDGALPFLFDAEIADIGRHHDAYPVEFPKVFVNFTRPLEVRWKPDALLIDGTRAGVTQRRFGGVLIRQKDAVIIETGAKTTEIRAYFSTWFDEPANYVDNFTVSFHRGTFPYFANMEWHRRSGTGAQAAMLHNTALNLMHFLYSERGRVETMDPRTEEAQRLLRAAGQYTARPFYAVLGRGN